MPVTSAAVSSPAGKGSDSLPVEIELFGAKTHLADSMQFFLEFLLRHGGKGVFYIMPTFRGEDSDETHLNEFFHSEAEIRGSLDDAIILVNEYLHHCTTCLLESSGDEIRRAAGTVAHLEAYLASGPTVPQLTFSDAKDLLKGDPRLFVTFPDGSSAISRAGERALLATCGPCLWLRHPECATVPFYQAIHPDGIHALSADFLIGVGEIVGCGERHSDSAAVVSALRAHEIDPIPYAWYLRMKEYLPLRTAGFGLGLERYLLWVLQHDDIRDLTLIPRLKGQRAAF